MDEWIWVHDKLLTFKFLRAAVAVASAADDDGGGASAKKKIDAIYVMAYEIMWWPNCTKIVRFHVDILIGG